MAPRSGDEAAGAAERPDLPPTRPGRLVAVGIAGIVALLFFFIVWREEHLPGYTLDKAYGFLGVVVLASAAVVALASRRRGLGGVVVRVLAVAPLVSVLAFAGAHLLNRGLDGPGRDEQVTVRAVVGKGPDPDRQVHFAVGGRDYDIHYYRPPAPGRPLLLRVYPGRFGWSWCKVLSQRE